MKKKLTDYLKMTVGAVIFSVEVYFISMQNGFSIGGVSGLAIVLGNVIPSLTPGILLPAINIFLIILGFLLLGVKNGLRTTYCTVLYSGLVWAFERFVPMSAPLTNYPLLELIYTVLLGGIASAVLFDCGASSGGTDIVALILQKYTHLDIGRALLYSDFIITTLSFFIFGLEIGMFSMLGLFAKSFILDNVIESINECKSFMIITEKADPIVFYIIETMNHTATTIDAEGQYTHKNKKAVITLCKRIEAVRLKKKIREIDPDAFVIVTSTSEIIGRGFRNL